VADLSGPGSPLQELECRFTTPSKDAGMQNYNSFSGCKNAGSQLLRMQEFRFIIPS
jgi:hypothetical protein